MFCEIKFNIIIFPYSSPEIIWFPSFIKNTADVKKEWVFLMVVS